MPTTTKTTKPADKKTAGATLKEKLAAGAAALRAAKEQEKASKKELKPVAKAKPAKPAAPPEEPVKAVTVAKGDINAILEAHVTILPGNTGVTIDKDTPAGEYVRIFDYFAALGERVQFLLGDVINAGENILGEKYAAVMAATGRPIGTLKQYAYVARNVPPELRSLHPALGYTHIAEVAKVPQIEDKKAILEAAAKAAKEGHPMTVKEVRLKADKLVPRKPRPAKKSGKSASKPKAKPAIEMSAEQQAIYDNVLEAANNLDELLTGKNEETLRAFVFKISYKEKKVLLDATRATRAFSYNLEKYLGQPAD